MRAIVIGVAAAAILAAVAALVLDSGVQQSAQERNQTQGVRL
jgi:hypothetical protein